jgi:hypothetical protein
MAKSNQTLIVITFILVTAGAFFGGMKYAESKSAASTANKNGLVGLQNGQGQNFRGQNGGFGRGANGGGTSGEILSMDDKSITVKLRDGGSKIIFFSPSSKITKSVDGAVSDLKVGESIMAAGTANSDGSLTAQTIQLRPNMLNPASVPNAVKSSAGL